MQPIHWPLEQLLPHAAPMILLSRALSWRDDCLLAEVDISPASHLFDEALGGVPSYICIEYMAQAIAALAGCRALAHGLPVQIGFLLGSRKLQLHQPLLAAGSRVQVQVSRLLQDPDGLSVFDCQLLDSSGQLLAEANVNVFQPDNAEAFIHGTAQS